VVNTESFEGDWGVEERNGASSLSWRNFGGQERRGGVQGFQKKNHIYVEGFKGKEKIGGRGKRAWGGLK